MANSPRSYLTLTLTGALALLDPIQSQAAGAPGGQGPPAQTPTGTPAGTQTSVPLPDGYKSIVISIGTLTTGGAAALKSFLGDPKVAGDPRGSY